MARDRSGHKPPKWNYVSDVLRDALLTGGVGKREGMAYVFRGIGKHDGVYPRASTPREFWENLALRGKAFQTIVANAEKQPAAAVAALFCPQRMGEHFPGHERFTVDERATAALTFAVFHPNNTPVAA
jgi:hypothetical protein